MKPISVRVAEAVGWDTSGALHQRDEAAEGQSACSRCGAVASWSSPLPDLCVPRYDTDWLVTGPLIERHGMEFMHIWPGDRGQAGFWWSCWRSADARGSQRDRQLEGIGETPLIAVCNLILALSEAGRLARSA